MGLGHGVLRAGRAPFQRCCRGLPLFGAEHVGHVAPYRIFVMYCALRQPACARPRSHGRRKPGYVFETFLADDEAALFHAPAVGARGGSFPGQPRSAAPAPGRTLRRIRSGRPESRNRLQYRAGRAGSSRLMRPVSSTRIAGNCPRRRFCESDIPDLDHSDSITRLVDMSTECGIVVDTYNKRNPQP